MAPRHIIYQAVRQNMISNVCVYKHCKSFGVQKKGTQKQNIILFLYVFFPLSLILLFFSSTETVLTIVTDMFYGHLYH